jgi:hypothetical protein
VTGSGDAFPAPASRGMLSLFVLMLAAAVLFDRALLGDRRLQSPHLALAAAALWAALRPCSPARAATLLAAFLLVWLLDLPMVSNHVMLTGIALGAYAPWIAAARLARGRWPDAAAAWAHLAPLMRGCVLLLYAFAALAKLNAGFLDPELGCGAVMYRRLAIVPFLPRAPWAAQGATWGALVVELALPLLLLFRATRLAGVLLAVPFHGVLAAAGHVPFSAYALMLLTAFLPEDFAERLRACRDASPRLLRWSALIASLAGRPWAFPALLASWLATVVTPTSRWIPTANREFDEGLLLPFGLWLGATSTLLALALRRPRRYVFGALRPRHPLLALGPGLVLLNGIQPYLGLKTGGSFTMYSNLQTEGTGWNHMLLPRALKRFALQDDLVRVVDSSDQRLRETARDGSSWVYFQFHRYVSRRPEIAVSFERGGRRRTVPRVGSDPALARPPNPVIAKLLHFRDVDPVGCAVCRR